MNLESIKTYASEVKTELHTILEWWANHTLDKENGGFYGRIANDNAVIPNAEKGLVLNARILYTFSAAHALSPKENYLAIANRAFNYLIEHFSDKVNGGFYWSVDEKGNMLDAKKQIYGQAFVIYAFAEYYKITNNEIALSYAKEIFSLLELYSFDKANTGYLEAFTKEWQPIADPRLSDKDQNEKKTMNTHLHIIEAYANLYSVWEDERLKTAINSLLKNFNEHIINKETNHLNLFLTEQWEVKSSIVSYGHDIEAAWLLQEAAETIGDETAIKMFKNIALKLTDATIEGLAKNGALHYELDKKNSHLVEEFHWWPQAEATVGFYNAWQINGNLDYLSKSLQSWTFIKNHIKDYENGEWFWGVNGDYSLMLNEDKAGFWKCPYHNGRACIEIIKRTAQDQS
ncbi:AGE family epimerase/isomerase [Pedobacter arcticus]|uniref:AGE family epimerase/isomerase n=1 Tax=Pedobacter arcticus TaxID=752140 RepID=UPI0002FB5D36|nr:AGE family epimerase/isomerase [Pedobacter arcticus]